MTDVSELIERVARAIFEDDENVEGGRISLETVNHWFDDRNADCKRVADNYRRNARAAIEASGVQSLSERNAVLEAKALSYDHAHEDAVEMGYPSLTEALEHLDDLRSALTKEGIENG